MAATATPVGAISVERLFAAYEGGSTQYSHPEETSLAVQYLRERRKAQYFDGIPGLEAAVSRADTKAYVDSGAGAACASEEIALNFPHLQVIAISRTDFRGVKQLPENMAYVVEDSRAALQSLETEPSVIVDFYGAFTFDVYHQPDLIAQYLNVLHVGGQGFIRYDGDHIGVVNRSGMMLFLSEWYQQLHHPNIRAFEGPNPTGPTSFASVLVLTKHAHASQRPDLTLMGIRQFCDDVVPFVGYAESRR